MRRLPVGPLLSLAALALIIPVAAQFLSVDAFGRVLNDWSGEPVSARITFGARFAHTDEAGEWRLGPVPIGARLHATATSFGDEVFSPGETEVRMSPNRLTLQIKDSATASAIPDAEVRHQDRLLGRSGGTGQAFVSHPGKDEALFVCANTYAPRQIVVNATEGEVALDPGGAGCPPLPTPTPAPTPSPTPAPTPTTTPAASPTRSP